MKNKIQISQQHKGTGTICLNPSMSWAHVYFDKVCSNALTLLPFAHALVY